MYLKNFGAVDWTVWLVVYNFLFLISGCTACLSDINQGTAITLWVLGHIHSKSNVVGLHSMGVSHN